jgi:cytochrome c oxidase cbb3-type subunit 3
MDPRNQEKQRMTEDTSPPEGTLLEHEADGIRELDNLLPRWWVWLFHVTIIFSVLYMLYFHVFRIGDLSRERYTNEMEAAAAQAALRGGGETAALTEPATDPAILARGKELFNKHCTQCHAGQGQGTALAPNLTDYYFIHGPAFADTVRTVTEGVPAQGMLAWKNLMPRRDIHAVASYAYTLRGTNPPKPKEPQGEHYPPGSEAPATAGATNATPTAATDAAATNAPDPAPPPTAVDAPAEE